EFVEATRERRDASDEFEFRGPRCNLRDIDLGIAVGSAAKAASLYNVDTRCQTRIAVAARKLGLIRSEVAVALSMSVTHKNPGFDARMPAADFDAAETPMAPTGTAPVKTPEGRWAHRPDLPPEE
ncbi:MAG TPA: ferredoxin domain-containing protein, partial [Stellaceae bacterium]|nr:ferredoxin domain-containing protein [Stellaceae bacterium]